MMFERVTRWIVLLSAVVAVLCGTWLGARAWAPLMPLSIGAFVAAFVIGKYRGTVATAPVMVFAYTFPAVLLLWHGEMDQAYWNIWMAGLLGGSMATGNLKAWSFPPRWKWPLAYWALAVALVWPALVAREADFTWALMSEYHVGNSFFGGSPPVIAVWITQISLLHMLGLLWLDSACLAFPLSSATESLSRFSRDVLWPLVVSLVLGSCVAIYQGVVDLTWLSGHQYSILGRATASLDDGNAFGAAAGLWIGGLLALAACTSRRWVQVTAILAAGLVGAGLWQTGSRMAFFAALVCLAFAAASLVERRKVPVRDLLVLGLPALALIGTMAYFAERNATNNPLHRSLEALPGWSVSEWREWASFQLWNRYGPFGTVSMNMVRDFPLSGVGVGNFNHIFPDESFALTGFRAHQDNAQSWYRHQLAELGLVGSLGWLIWLPMFVSTLWRTRGDVDRRFAAKMVKGALVAIGLISTVSMPTQALPVALTVWVLVYWYLLLSPSAVADISRPFFAKRPSVSQAAAWGLALVFVGATLWSGWRSLRPPQRAIKADWTYQLGMMNPEPPTDGTQPDGPPPFKWTAKHAVEVLPVSGKWLKLTVGGGPPDIALHPIRLEIKRSGRWIIGVTRQDLASQTFYVRAPEGAKRMMLEFDVSRTWRPSDFGGTDERALGMSIYEWTFVSEPPRGFVQIQ